MAVYEEYYTASRRKRDQLSDVIPRRSMIAPGVLLQKLRHGLQRSDAVRGPDVMGESEEVMGALMLQANEVLKRLGGRWMLQSEAQRRRVTTLPAVAWPPPILHLLDQERRHTLLTEPGSRETRYYMTLSWWPPTAGTRQGLRFLISGEQPDVVRQAAHEDDGLTHDQRVSLIAFVREADSFMDLLKGMLATCRPLSIDETTTYLHNCVSNRWYELGPMAFYHDLDSQLCDTAFWGGWYPALGSDPQAPDAWHLRTCSIMGYPAASNVGMVRHLDAANLDYRWCTRWVGLEKHVQSGLLCKTKAPGWGRKNPSWAASQSLLSLPRGDPWAGQGTSA